MCHYPAICNLHLPQYKTCQVRERLSDTLTCQVLTFLMGQVTSMWQLLIKLNYLYDTVWMMLPAQFLFYSTLNIKFIRCKLITLANKCEKEILNQKWKHVWGRFIWRQIAATHLCVYRLLIRKYSFRNNYWNIHASHSLVSILNHSPNSNNLPIDFLPLAELPEF